MPSNGQSSEAMLKIRGIRKAFGSNEVLKGIDLDVDDGEVVAVIGSSGSGKTTLLRCINFLERADHGTMEIAGDPIDFASMTKKDIDRMRRHTSMVFQQYNLFKNKTALENITEGLIYARGMSKSEAADEASKLLVKVGLEDRMSYYPKQLSGGQQQRIGIARALALKPDLLLLDEPTSALDVEKVGEVLAVIKEIAREKQTMLIVTHELQFAREVSNRIIFIEDGVIVEEGEARELFEHPKQLRTKEFLRTYLERGV